MKIILFRPLCCLLLTGLFFAIVFFLPASSGQAVTQASLMTDAPQARLILAGPPDLNGAVIVQGFAGAVPSGSQVNIVNAVFNISASTAANPDGSFRASILATAGTSLSISYRKDGTDSSAVTILTFSPTLTGLLPVIGGTVNDLAIAGLMGYVADAAGLKILDFRKQGTTAIIGTFFSTTPATGIALYNQYVFMTSAFSGTALRVIDARDSANPRQIASLFPASGGSCLALSDDYSGQVAAVGGYFAGKGNGVQLVDISNPAAPVALGFVTLGSSPQAIKVMNHFAYVAMGAAGIQVVDFSNTSAPVIAASISEKGNASRLAFVSSLFGTLLAVPANEGLNLFTLNNPLAPRYFLTALPGLPAYDVAPTSYGLVAVATGGQSAGVQLLSLRSPFAPRLIGAYPTDGTGSRLGAGAGLMVLASTGNNPALTLFDTVAPFPPSPIYAIPQASTVAALAVQNSSMLVAANIRNFGVPNRNQLLWANYSTPQRPTLNAVAGDLGTLSAAAFSTDGRWALVGASDGAELQVLDTATRQLIGRLAMPFGARINAIKVRGSRAYLAGGGGGLFIVELGVDGRLPQFLGGADTPGGALGLDIAGNFAYVADNLTGLQVVDIINPTAPRVIAAIATPGAAQDVHAQGNQLFLAYATVGTSNGLGIYELTNPAQPTLLGKVATNGYATRVDTAGDLAYVASTDAGLVIIDARNPRQPVVARNFKTAGPCRDVKADGAMVYIADDNALAAAIFISPLVQP